MPRSIWEYLTRPAGPAKVVERVCEFDDCQKGAHYMLTAMWLDGRTSRREVCSVHLVRGIRLLHDFRQPDPDELTIMRCGHMPRPGERRRYQIPG